MLCITNIYLYIPLHYVYLMFAQVHFLLQSNLAFAVLLPLLPLALSVGDGHRAFAWPVWLAPQPPPPRCDAPLNGISFGNELTSWFHFSDCRRTRTGLAVCRVCCHRCCCCCCCWMRLYLRHCGTAALRLCAVAMANVYTTRWRLIMTAGGQCGQCGQHGHLARPKTATDEADFDCGWGVCTSQGQSSRCHDGAAVADAAACSCGGFWCSCASLPPPSLTVPFGLCLDWFSVSVLLGFVRGVTQWSSRVCAALFLPFCFSSSSFSFSPSSVLLNGCYFVLQ